MAPAAHGKTTLPAEPLSGSDTPRLPFAALVPCLVPTRCPKQHPPKNVYVLGSSHTVSSRRSSPERDGNLPLKHTGRFVPLRAAVS